MKFQLGQVVEVVNTGAGYTGYETMAKKMQLDKFSCYGNTEQGQIGEVVAYQPHPDFADELYGILIEDQHFIVGEGGLKLIAEAQKKIPLRPNWSFAGSLSEREAAKALCLLIGYKVPESHVQMSDWSYLAVSRFENYAVAYSNISRTHHFTDLGKLVLFLLDDKAELRALLEEKMKEVAELTAQIAA